MRRLLILGCFLAFDPAEFGCTKGGAWGPEHPTPPAK